MAMKLVLRGDPKTGDEWEPTLRAVCIEDLEILEEEDIIEVEATLYTREGTIYDILLEEANYEVYLKVYSTTPDECLKTLELRIRGCRERGVELLKNVDWPEVSKIVIEGDCVELIIPSEPPPRIKNTLRKLGIAKAKPIAFRPGHNIHMA